MRAKAENVPEESPTAVSSDEVEVIDISKYRPKKVASLTWRECIKKIWKTDPLICPGCLHEMRIISFITETSLIKKILKYLDLWDEPGSPPLRDARDPPRSVNIPDEIVYLPIEDPAWDWQESPDLVG